MFLLLTATGSASEPIPNQAPSSDLDSQISQVIQRYFSAVERQREAMLGAEMELNLKGRLVKMEESGFMKVMRKISAVGEISFKVIDPFDGDNTVKKQLFERFLKEEQETRAFGALAVTEDGYLFRLKYMRKHNGKQTYVFDITPRRNDEGMVRGEVEIDGETGMPLRESIEPARNPDFRLSGFNVLREYEIKNGISVIKRMVTQADVKLFGRAELEVEYHDASAPEEATLNAGF